MSTNSSANLAARVRQERLRLGWTQVDTAARAGLSDRNYRRFELLGRTTIDQFIRIVSALGLSVELASLAGTALVPDPRAARTRQRGVRHSRPQPGPVTTPRASRPVPAAAPAVATYHPVVPDETLPESDAAMMKKYRDAINRLVGVIVGNRLTNWSAAQVVRNSMASNAVPEADKRAYVGGVLAKLAQLSPENIGGYGCRPEELEAWKLGWHFDQPIHGALD